ncbi:hypothetical protein C6A36_01715, partial [Desulfobacteraceae bacterium SEEP-SAG10]
MKRNLNWLLCVIFAFGWLVLFANEAVSKEIAIITCYGSGEVAFIDIEKAKVLKTIKLKDQASLPIDVAITPDGETAVVTCNTGYICFIDVKKMKCRKTLKLLSGPEQYGISLQPNEFSHVCITSNGKTAIVTEQNELGQIFKFDIETMALLGEPFYLGDEPGRIIINSNTSPHEFYVLDNGSIHILKKGSLPYFVPTPAGNDEIDDFALTPDGSRVIFVDSDNWIYLIST